MSFEPSEHSTRVSAQQAAEIYTKLTEKHVAAWVMGGWGIDALLGEETREHHDIDVLIDSATLQELRSGLDDLGFKISHIWKDENQWIEVADTKMPTAFVARNDAQLELDVHIIKLDTNGNPSALCNVPWQFNANSLSGIGVLAGVPIRCVSGEAQIAMHQGYELPAHHLSDLERLKVAKYVK